MLFPKRRWSIPKLLPCAAVAIAFAHATLAATELRFVLPDDLSQAEGVKLSAQLPGNGIPLLTKDQTRPSLWYMPVAALPAGNAVRIWYQRVNKQESEFSDQRTLCVGDLAESGWSLVAVNQDVLPWGGPNNVCMRRSPHTPTWGGFNVFQLLPSGTGLEMLYWDQPDASGKAGTMRASSQDGLAWEKRPGTVFTETNDAFTAMQVGDTFLLYQTMLEDWPDKPYPDNLDKKKRVIALRESSDLQTWTPQEVFLRPDSQDARECEFYLMKTFRYGEAYAGLVMKYYADPKLPGKHSAILKYELIVSENGRTWQRPFRDTDLGFWSYADPFVHQGKMHFAVWKDDAMKTVAYGPGRLIGVTAEAEGSFKTRPVKGFGKALHLNLDARNGWAEVACVGATAAQPPVVLGRVENVDGEHVDLPLPVKSQFSGEATMLFQVRLHHATLFGMYFE